MKSAAPARTYFARPAPSLTVDNVATLFLAPRNRTRATVPAGMPLTEFEKVAAGAARREGFLWSRHNCGQSATNEHFKFCCNTRIPYVAVNRDGSEIVVDLRPVGGLGKLKRDGDIDSVLAAFQGVLAGRNGFQIANVDSLKVQQEKAAPGPMQGSNSDRIADSTLSDTFTIYTPGRDAGLALAAELTEAYRKALRLPSAEMRGELRSAINADRVAARHALMVRKLKKLVADPVAVKNLRVKAGAVDGFVAALKAGTAHVVPPK